jgi:hypothetical protein
VLQVYVDLLNLMGAATCGSTSSGAALYDDGRLVVNCYDGDELLPFLPSIEFRYEF